MIRGLIVRFNKSNTDDPGGKGSCMKGDFSPGRSLNWDSVVGTKEIVCFREGRRIYNL